MPNLQGASITTSTAQNHEPDGGACGQLHSTVPLSPPSELGSAIIIPLSSGVVLFFSFFEICYLNHSFLIFVQSDPRLNVVGTNTVSNHRLTVFRVLQVSPSNILLSPVTPRNRVDLASQHADSTGPSPFSCCSFSPPDISQVR